MKAVVFDMDGVIADTEKFHTEAKQQILSEYDIEISDDELKDRFAGTPSEQMFSQLFDENNIEDGPQATADRKREIYHELIEGNVDEIPGVADLIEDLSSSYPLILASSSAPRNIKMILETTNLEKFFQEKISAKENGIKGKPAPDIYRDAAKRLDVDPEDCVAVEDSKNGAKSARRAGMNVIGYKLDNEDVDLTIENFEELDQRKLEKL